MRSLLDTLGYNNPRDDIFINVKIKLDRVTPGCNVGILCGGQILVYFMEIFDSIAMDK